MFLIETNIDDTSGEVLGYLMEKLLESQALDVFFTPIYMKKNRPATQLSVLCYKEDIDNIKDIIFSETSTIGIRIIETDRITMEREIIKVNTIYGDISVKKSTLGDIMKYAPEYEDCKKIAIEHGLTLKEVMELVKNI